MISKWLLLTLWSSASDLKKNLAWLFDYHRISRALCWPKVLKWWPSKQDAWLGWWHPNRFR